MEEERKRTPTTRVAGRRMTKYLEGDDNMGKRGNGWEEEEKKARRPHELLLAVIVGRASGGGG